MEVDWLIRKVEDSRESGKILFEAVFSSIQNPTFKVVFSSEVNTLFFVDYPP